MSEISKGDTSSSLIAPPSSGRVVKNPLLSASVTGLTFDDFHNKPLLLPAAPPIIHPTPVASRESTPLVTVGKSSEIDTENLSEINLNDTSATSSSNLADTSDENSNSLIESTSQIDNSILSQAASSFSQLPSVASSVFSTFSKKFNSSSGRDDINSNPQLDIQPFTTPFVGQSSVTQPQILPPPSAFGNQQQQYQSSAPPPQNQPQAAPVDPPTFYSPAEIPSAPSGNTCPPPASGQNTYRLSAKKKHYAQIPGLSSSHQEPTLPTSATVFPPPIGFESLGTPVYPEQTSYEKQEERKGGLFSLSNLGVPNVLQNLSGLVQSATGISQRPQEHQQIQQEPFNNFGNNQVGQTPSSAFYLQTTTNNSTGISQSQPPQSAVNFFAPPASIPSASLFPGQVPSIATELSAPYSQLPQGSSTTGVPFSGPPPKSNTPEASLVATQQQQLYQPVTSTSSSRPPSVGNQFAGLPPKTVTPESNPSFKPFATHQPSQPEFKLEKGSSSSSSNLFGPPPTAGLIQTGQSIGNLSPLIPISAPQVQSTGVYFAGPPTNIDKPEAYSTIKPFVPSQTSFVQTIPSGIPYGVPALNSFTPETNLASQLPPQVKPPSAGPPSTSFRLQKGTRLYKSPFAAAPAEYQPQVHIPHNTFPPNSEAVSYFNPQGFGTSQGIAQSSVTQETTLNPVQEPSISAPANISSTPSSFSAPPLTKTPQGPPPTSEAVNFFNPQGFTPPSGLLDPSKRTTPTNILDPSTEAQGISSKPPVLVSFPSTNLPPFDKVDQPPTVEVENFFDQQLPTPPSELDIQKVDDLAYTRTREPSPDKPLVSDQIQSSQEKYFPSQTPEQSKPPGLEQASTIITESEAKQETEPEEKQDALTFLQEQQNNILPPPPAASFGIPTPSKETANFPPPPPQHSFQNKPSSNPYRKGLHPHNSQLPAPTSLSSFFTPIDQGNNFFQTIGSETIPNLPQSTATFFAETSSAVEQEKRVSPAPEFFKAPEELNVQHSEESSIDLKPLPSAPPSEKEQPEFAPAQTEAPLLTQESTPVLSVIPEQNKLSSSQELKINPLKPEAPVKPVSPQPVENLVSFYKPDTLPTIDQQIESSKIASPTDSQETPVPEQQPVASSFAGFFDQAAPTLAAPNPVVVHRPSLPDPTTFFDSFSLVPSLGIAAPPPEDPNSQRIQNFFNNPPPKELDTVGDLNYNLVGSGLSVQNLQIRSLTPASNLAEPPSSSCSEFSELNSSLSAANRQPLIQAADSTKVSPEEEAVFESPEYQDLPEEIVKELKMANSILGTNSPTNETYKPAVKHWFYKRKLDVKCLWTPFSYHDSALLEEAFLKDDLGSNLVAVEGGRFDVNISERTKTPVYWEGEPIEVKRCSWFYKASDSKYVPYEEEIADLLEEEYKKASESCEWHKKIPISAGDIVVFHGPTVIVHFQPQQQVDSWGGSTPDSKSFLSNMKQQTITRPRVVKRDLDDFHIDEGESHKVDHLLFMVHGIGSACDLKMRSVEEVVDEFRSIALQLVQSHYKNSVESGFVGRVEVLPVSWHSELHSDELGIDEKLKSITLESIPKLRNFTNDTLLDILFYTSPLFCQRIINTVTASMNSIYVKYKQRNPEFQGGVSLAGHSLGSLIMFDLLCHQRPHKEPEEKNMENPDEIASGFPVDSNQLNEEAAKNITYKMGQAGTGQPFISYPQLLFQPKKFFALGSPIGMFVTIRGIDKLGLDFRLPTCPGFYNIFHPYDPVAYRLEALVNPDMTGIPPVLIPHHKGRKRMHLELKETMSRVGADLKQRFFETFKTTIDSVNFLTPKLKNDPKELEKEVDKLLELQSHQEQQVATVASTSRSRANSNSTNQSDTDVIEIDFPLGKLNDSKRVDYVLQEAPLEFFNEYLFALSSHVCYWESEDTILFVMKQIYSGIGFSPDSQVPQQTLTIERPSSSSSTTQQSPTS